MSHVAKSSTIEIIQKPSKPVAVCHDEFICHGFKCCVASMRLSHPTVHKEPGVNLRPTGKDSMIHENEKRTTIKNMKNERKVQTYPELLIVLKSIDQLGKKTCCFKQLGIG